MAAATVRVEGLSELNRALKQIDKELAGEVRDTLRNVAEPVRREAEGLARTRIPTVSDRWAMMRVGVTNRDVYVAPKARRRSGAPRPAFGIMLLEEAMIPALERNAEHVEDGLGDMIDRLGNRHGF